MKKLFAATAIALAVSAAHATPVYHPPGANLTYGAVSNPQSLMSDITNPAASAAQLARDGGHVQFGLLSTIGIGVEYGQVDNIFDVVDEKAKAYSDGLAVTIPTLTVLDADPTNDDLTADVNAIQNAVQVPVDDINNVLAVVARDGYGKVFGSAALPLMPIVVGSDLFGGALVLDANVSVTTKANEIHDNIDLDLDPNNIQTQLLNNQQVLNLGEVSLDLNTQTLTVDNDTLLQTRAAGVGELALGFSRRMFEHEAGSLFAGVRAKYYKVGMTQTATRLASLTDSEQLLRDIQDATFHYESGFGLDLGALWVAEHYRLGATVNNVNAPQFTFPGLDTSGYTNPQIKAALARDYVYKMDAQLSLEGAVYTANQRWVISGAYDTVAVADPFGDDYQWATLSAAYATESWWIPGARVGYRANLAGEKVSYVTAGATLFRVLNLDLAMALDSVTIDNTTVPRGAMVNLGLDVSF